MENRNIYKMDDALIAASFLMLVPAAYFAWPWLLTLPQAEGLGSFFLSAPALLGARLNMVYLYLGGSLLAQIFGRIIRKQEKQALDVLDTILYMRNTSLGQLAVNLNISPSKVERITGKLSRIASLNIKVEGDSVKMDSPLSGIDSVPKSPMAKSLSKSSPETEVKGEQKHADEPASLFDNAAIEEKLKDKSLTLQEKLTLLSQMATLQNRENGSETVRKTAESFAHMGPEEQKKMKRNAIIMVILFMTPLWPVALIMVIVFVVRQAKGKGIMIQPAPMGEELPPEQE